MTYNVNFEIKKVTVSHCNATITLNKIELLSMLHALYFKCLISILIIFLNYKYNTVIFFLINCYTSLPVLFGDDGMEGNLNPGILVRTSCSCVLMTFLLTKSWIILTFLLRMSAKSFGGILSLNTFLTAVGATYWINIFRIQKFRSSLDIMEAFSAILNYKLQRKIKLLFYEI